MSGSESLRVDKSSKEAVLLWDHYKDPWEHVHVSKGRAGDVQMKKYSVDGVFWNGHGWEAFEEASQ